ncbi:MAG: FAD binding domain-containing protein [Anaerolineae bacterium]
MSSKHFDYVRASSCAEAVAFLSDPTHVSRLLAGGTDLMVLRHKGEVNWNRLVDISRIPEMRAISMEDGWIVVGAAVTHAEIVEHPLIQRYLPLLSDACHSIGSPQIRNRGTIGGNVANAAACADTLPALVCLDAVARIVTKDGEVAMPVKDVVVGPNRTSLPPASVIRDFVIPIPPHYARMVFFKIGRRQVQSISRLSLACLGWLDADGRVAEVRIVPGACTPQTQRFDQAEAVIRGQIPTEELVREAGQAGAAQMIAITGRRWSTPYKELALPALIERALRRVFGLPEVR